ncbi:WD40 repeat domain-containing protein [Nocardia sp. NPDC059240]|uniref:WD40 repeat domain-containing protein n=1 Tax=Nocardia sp. NPDC059240 TaxID=3346786 RepID=UPI0036ADAD90
MFAADSTTLVICGEDYLGPATPARGYLETWTLSDHNHPELVGAPIALGPYGWLSVSGGTVLAMRVDSATIQLWKILGDAAPVKVGPPLPKLATQITALALSPDGKFLAAATGTELTIWALADPSRPELVTSATLKSVDPIRAISFSADTGMLATASGPPFLQHADLAVWDFSDHRHLAAQLEPSVPLFLGISAPIVFDPAATSLAARTTDGIELWDTDKHHAVNRICASTIGVLTRDNWSTYVPQLPFRSMCP